MAAYSEHRTTCARQNAESTELSAFVMLCSVAPNARSAS